MTKKRSFLVRNRPVKIDGVVKAYMESIDTPRSLAVWLCFKYDHNALLTLDIDPSMYLDRESFHKDYLATKFLSKYNGLDIDVDPKAVALEKFRLLEDECHRTNQRLKRLTPRGDVGAVLYSAIGKISSLIGDLGSRELDEIFDYVKFGPGVTSSCKGKWLSVNNKLRARSDATPLLHRVLEGLQGSLGSFPWIDSINQRQGNTLATVPKDSKTDRTIAVEPHLNAFFQRGVGIFLRKRLRRWGIDLRDQSANQELAQIGSFNDSYATIDLSGASDTVSSELVNVALPESWSRLLNTLRSPFYEWDGKWVSYAKHSSMGNGYTFELETMLFASFVLGTYKVLGIKDRFCVYGDDIIVNKEAVPLLLETLRYCGFSPNTNKTFVTGPFRESCGSDWYHGEQCRPFFFKKKNDIVQVLTFANWLRKSSPSFLNISSVWKACLTAVPPCWRIKGPEGSPGLSFWVNWWEIDPTAQILHRKPYGPVIGIKADSVHFVPFTRPIDFDRLGMYGALLQARDRPQFLWRCGVPVPIDLPNGRHSAREAGRWVQRSVIFTDDWPMVKVI